MLLIRPVLYLLLRFVEFYFRIWIVVISSFYHLSPVGLFCGCCRILSSYIIILYIISITSSFHISHHRFTHIFLIIYHIIISHTFFIICHIILYIISCIIISHPFFISYIISYIIYGISYDKFTHIFHFIYISSFYISYIIP